MKVRAVIFAAVSSAQQVSGTDGDEKDSIPSQIQRGRDVIAARGWQEIADPLVVSGQSRSLNWLHDAFESIHAYRQLRTLVENGTVDLLVIRSYDRLARTATLQAQVSAWLKENGIQLFALEMPTEVSDPLTWRPRDDSTRLWVEAIAGAQAEGNINSLVNFHRYGMDARAKKGQHNEGVPVYGYRDVVAEDGFGKGKRKRIPDPTEFPILQRIVRMLREGRTLQYVARWLNGEVDNPDGARLPIPTRRGSTWSAASLTQIVRNPFIAGKVARYRFTLRRDGLRQRKSPREPGILADGVHEPAISYETWLALQDILDERAARAPRLRRFDYLWSGLAVCGYCLDRGEPRAMRYHHDIQHNKGNGALRVYDYLICSRYSASRGQICQRNHMTTGEYTALVYAWLAAAAANPAIAQMSAIEIADPSDQLRADLVRVRAALIQLDQEDRRWDEGFRAGILPLARYGDGLRDLESKRSHLAREELEYQKQLAAVDRSQSRRERRTQALSEFADLRPAPDDPAVVAIAHAVLARIELRDGQLTFWAN